MPSSKNGCFSRILLWLNFGLILTTAACYFAPGFSPSTFWPTIFLGMVFPVLMICHVLFIGLWAIFKKWYFVLSLVSLVVCWEETSLLIGHPFKGTDVRKIPVSKVITYNVATGKLDKKGELTHFLDKQKPDILCLQEFSAIASKWQDFNSNFKYEKTRKAQTIFSNYPIKNSGIVKIKGQNSSNGCIWADLEIQGKIVRVYNLHLSSNRISGKVENLTENTEVNNLNDEETWKETKSILSLVKASAKTRGEQVRTIRKHIASSPYPVIICGDFNDPPQSYTYRTLAKGFKDHFKEQGTGRGSTYNGNIPFLKIDYILSSPSVNVLSHNVVRKDYSDHFPVVSVVAIP